MWSVLSGVNKHQWFELPVRSQTPDERLASRVLAQNRSEFGRVREVSIADDLMLSNANAERRRSALLAGGEGRAAVPIESVKRHCCDGQAVVITETAEGEPLGIGRKSRIIPTAVERAVRARDHNRCVFPGCEHRRFLHCHHVEHWAQGGDTNLDNLLLLCTKHHTLVHEGGFRIDKDFLDRWAFFRPDGIAVPEVGYVSGSDDNPPAGGLLSAPENAVREPPPPSYLH